MTRRKLINKKRINRERLDLMRENKGAAITQELVDDMAMFFLGEGAGSLAVTAKELADEHELFANTSTPHELENSSQITAVGIGYYKKGRQEGYVLVSNQDKSGYGFPGGRVRLGESPEAALEREWPEETGLTCRVLSSEPLAQFPVGEGNHIFSAYPVEIIGGKIQVPEFNKEEPIDAVILVTKDELAQVCQGNGLLSIKGLPDKGILPSHRTVFLDLLLQEKQAEEAANV